MERHSGPQVAAVLDIGEDIGAVVVMAPESLVGKEIQLYAADGSAVMHTEVHAREVAGRTVHAGLFPAVRAGSYRVDAGRAEPVAVTVVGGAVSTVGG